jgi:hypothetical protein
MVLNQVVVVLRRALERVTRHSSARIYNPLSVLAQTKKPAVA